MCKEHIRSHRLWVVRPAGNYRQVIALYSHFRPVQAGQSRQPTFLVPRTQKMSPARSPIITCSSLKYRDSFESHHPQRYYEDVRSAQVQLLDAGHLALETTADEVSSLIRQFVRCTGQAPLLPARWRHPEEHPSAVTHLVALLSRSHLLICVSVNAILQ
jgi:hypothetical protein